MRLSFISFSLLFCSFFLSSCMSFNSIDFDPFDEEREPKESLLLSDTKAKDKIYLITLEGTIVSSNEGQGRGRISPRSVETALNRAARDDATRAVVLEINSPGGSAAASEDILKLIEKFKKDEGLPLVCYVSDTAASGGYYIAQACDEIIANPNSMIGSIGVISVFFNAEGLLKKKLDLDVVTIKSGALKDFGTPFRDMTKEEREYWKELTMRYYSHFLGVVAGGRKISTDSVKSLADGRVFHPAFAAEKKLIDRVGTLEDSINSAKGRAKISAAAVFRLDVGRNMGGLFGMSAKPGPLEDFNDHVLLAGMRNRILFLVPGL